MSKSRVVLPLPTALALVMLFFPVSESGRDVRTWTNGWTRHLRLDALGSWAAAEICMHMRARPLVESRGAFHSWPPVHSDCNCFAIACVCLSNPPTYLHLLSDPPLRLTMADNAAPTSSVVTTDLPLKLLAKGKVRDVYDAGSEAGDGDKMSESQDMDMENASVDGMSEEGTPSLVAFGEGARTPARQSTIGSPHGKAATPTGRDAKMIDGMTYDRNVVDTTSDLRRSTASPSGAEEAERIVRENMNTTSADRMRGGVRPDDLGKFGFEK